jgi:hypothetical protein
MTVCYSGCQTISRADAIETPTPFSKVKILCWMPNGAASAALVTSRIISSVFDAIVGLSAGSSTVALSVHNFQSREGRWAPL